ncbi:MAG TPA: hypothetical protein VFG23_21180 [Polyangia bacterium]|nr:hypothetical protein [Polyangia bacterium]
MGRTPTALPISLLVLVLDLGACVDLAKVDPGPRFIDDFADGSAPSWNRFGPWRCNDISGGQKGSPDAGAVDAGGSAPDAAGASTCNLALENPGDDDKQALESTFTLDDPLDGVREFPGTEIVTRTVSGTVDVTGFTQLVFSTILESAAPPIPALPDATQFLVELGCSAFPSDPLAVQAVSYTLNAGWAELRLSLSGFTLKNTSRNQSCLALLDSIHFVVMPGLADGASTGGTLHIDNISLQN